MKITVLSVRSMALPGYDEAATVFLFIKDLEKKRATHGFLDQSLNVIHSVSSERGKICITEFGS